MLIEHVSGEQTLCQAFYMHHKILTTRWWGKSYYHQPYLFFKWGNSSERLNNVSLLHSKWGSATLTSRFPSTLCLSHPCAFVHVSAAWKSCWCRSLPSILRLKRVYYHMWNRLPVQVRCMRQGAQGWCTGMTLRDRMGRGVGQSVRMGTHVHPWLISVNLWQKPPQYFKVIKIN